MSPPAGVATMWFTGEPALLIQKRGAENRTPDKNKIGRGNSVEDRKDMINGDGMK